MAFNPSEQLLVSAGGDCLAKIWDLTEKKCVATLQGHLQALVKVAWLNAGLQFVSASVDGVVKVWNVKKHACLNTFEMHSEKIWSLDFCQVNTVKTHNDDDDSYDPAAKEPITMMLTGGSDSSVKFWKDNTVMQVMEDNQAKLLLLEDEQRLSKLMRNDELCEAAILAFRLNKLRDFYFAMNRLIAGKLKMPKAYIPGLMPLSAAPEPSRLTDPIDSILISQTSMKQAIEENVAQEDRTQSDEQVKKVCKLLLTESVDDLTKLFDMIKKLNARAQYAKLAQVMLGELLPSLDPELVAKQLKSINRVEKWADISEAC